MQIKPIETTYNGVRFRSRTEARWAVFFDVAGIPWEYEPEGYEFDGERYLPDFWLPREGVFWEVKGVRPERPVVDKLRRFSVASGKRVFLACGAPAIGESVLSVEAEPDEESGLFDAWGWVHADRKVDGAIWLANFDTGFATAISPNCCDRYPMDTLGAHFAKARNFRFDWISGKPSTEFPAEPLIMQSLGESVFADYRLVTLVCCEPSTENIGREFLRRAAVIVDALSDVHRSALETLYVYDTHRDGYAKAGAIWRVHGKWSEVYITSDIAGIAGLTGDLRARLEEVFIDLESGVLDGIDVEISPPYRK